MAPSTQLKKTASKKTANKKAPAKKRQTRTVPQKSTRRTNTPVSGKAITSIKVRMYRAGTGDFFLLQFLTSGKSQFNMMVDCGCIHGGKASFAPLIEDLKLQTKVGGKSVIDLLVVTHEHADHVNGFQSCPELFDTIDFRKVWFAWTEDNTDKTANEYRKKYTKTKLALQEATSKLTHLASSGYFDQIYQQLSGVAALVDAKKTFIKSLDQLSALNAAIPAVAGSTKIPTMADLLKQWKVIKPNTEVEFLSPGEIRNNVEKATGIRFYVLGPPRDLQLLSMEEKKGIGYEKRADPSSKDFALVNALTAPVDGIAGSAPFDADYELKNTTAPVQAAYQNQPWRNIDNDWLFGAGGLALRFQRSINNTSLALAIQFEQSEKVLLFPGDAEYGNWSSWHDGLQWTIQQGGKSKKVDAKYLLENTVFYKVGHHLSQNGTSKEFGMDFMKHEDLVAMATLDFRKINTGWLNTMPNDFLGADLLAKTKGNLFFVGEYDKILKNIKTDRVTVKLANETAFVKANKAFKGKNYIEYEVQG